MTWGFVIERAASFDFTWLYYVAVLVPAVLRCMSSIFGTFMQSTYYLSRWFVCCRTVIVFLTKCPSNKHLILLKRSPCTFLKSQWVASCCCWRRKWSTSVFPSFMVEFSLYGASLFDSAGLLCKTSVIVRTWKKMFPLKIFWNVEAVTAFISAAFLRLVMSCLFNTSGVDACLQKWNSGTCRWKHTGAATSPFLYDGTAVFMCLSGGVVSARNLKDTCPWWDGGEPCPFWAVEPLLWQATPSAVLCALATDTGQGHIFCCPLQYSVT